MKQARSGGGGRSLRGLQRGAVSHAKALGQWEPRWGRGEVTAHVGLGPWEKWGPLAGVERGGTEGPFLLKAKRAECVMHRNPHCQHLPHPHPAEPWPQPTCIPELLDSSRGLGQGSPGSWLTRGEAGEAVPTAPHPQGALTWPHTGTCFGGSRAGMNKFTPQDSPLGVHLGPSHGWQAG